MPAPMAKEEEVRRISALLETGGRITKAARLLGIKAGTLKQFVSDRGWCSADFADPLTFAKRGYAPGYDLVHPAAPGLTLKGTSLRYNGQGEVEQYWNKTKQQGLDPEQAHHLPDPKRITKLSTLYDQEGRVVQQWVAEKPEEAQREFLWRAFAEELAADLPKLPPRPAESHDYHAELMTVIPFGDPHFGLYCWAEEVGNDFNLDIAKRDLCAAVDWLVSQAPPAPRCIIANLGDFFHADNLEGRTSKSGHVLDMDTRLPKVVRIGVSAMRQAIETALERHQTVEVVNAIGNHDDVLSMVMSIMLSHVYEDEPRVIIHDAPTKRHYIRHGKVLLGITHGHQTKDAGLPGIMATERPEDWGLTRHRYWYRGHHHHDSRQEFPGCMVEQFRTLAPGDAYAVGSGYLSGRDMKLIVHHAEFGEVSRTTCSIDLLRHLGAAA